MAERPRELAELAFQDLITSEEVELISEAGDLHIAGDEWTLVLEGDPVADVLIALDSEDGSPEGLLQEAISDEAFAAMRDLDAQMDGDLTALMSQAPDAFARALADLLLN